MIITLMIGLLMFIMFSIVGIAVQSLFENSALSDRKGGKLFDSVWLGIVTFSVYAQIYSLFGAVSEGAVLGALLLTGGIFLFFHKKYLRLVKELLAWQNGTVNKRIIRIILFGVCVIVALSWGVQGIGHYDTYLYHAQNIRWIEEYGIVKGLGNLHNRFAYNSSFMCIQTLFSFKWLLGQSLHTLNTFLWVFMMTYAAGTIQLFKTGKVLLSDFLKLLIFLYLCSESVFSTLSSPHTDMMTLLLVAYILTRWVELQECGEKEITTYGLLCLLGVFAVSVKLSAVLALVLVIRPMIILIREKNWKSISMFLGGGILIILPFLIRNIILSGYLVYPYASIDLFNVDWKMPSFQVAFDNHEIIAWGRKLNDVYRYSEPMSVWLPNWLKNVEIYEAAFMLLNIMLIPVSICMLLLRLRNKEYNECLVLLCITVLFAGWFFTAPLPRYGMVYLYMIPLYYLWIIFEKMASRFKKNWMSKIAFSAFLFVGSAYTLAGVKELSLEEYLLLPADYGTYFEMQCIEWHGIKIYAPKNGDQGNYEEFPRNTV